MKNYKIIILTVLIISIMGLTGCTNKTVKVAANKTEAEASANQNTSSWQYDKVNNDNFWIPNESGNYITESGILLSEEELENLRMYLSDATIASMPQDVYDNQCKGYKGHGGFSMRENFITDNFIYSKEEASKLERDEIVARTREELSNVSFPSDSFKKYIDVTKADYDETEDVWRITYTVLKGNGEQYIAYMTGKGKTMYLIYTSSQH